MAQTFFLACLGPESVKTDKLVRLGGVRMKLSLTHRHIFPQTLPNHNTYKMINYFVIVFAVDCTLIPI